MKQSCLNYQNSLIVCTFVLDFTIFWIIQHVQLCTVDMINLYINLCDLCLPWLMRSQYFHGKKNPTGDSMQKIQGIYCVYKSHYGSDLVIPFLG